jgi:hypothetical protein
MQVLRKIMHFFVSTSERIRNLYQGGILKKNNFFVYGKIALQQLLMHDFACPPKFYLMDIA